MTRAALVAPVRTPVGRFGGALRDVSAVSVATTVVKETVARSGIDPELIAEVALGQSYASSEAPCIGRWAALVAGGGDARHLGWHDIRGTPRIRPRAEAGARTVRVNRPVFRSECTARLLQSIERYIRSNTEAG